jgi:hypothetical protein
MEVSSCCVLVYVGRSVNVLCLCGWWNESSGRAAASADQLAVSPNTSDSLKAIDILGLLAMLSVSQTI